MYILNIKSSTVAGATEAEVGVGAGQRSEVTGGRRNSPQSPPTMLSVRPSTGRTEGCDLSFTKSDETKEEAERHLCAHN